MKPLDYSEFDGLLESLFPGEEWEEERARVMEFLSAHGVFTGVRLPPQAMKYMTNPLSTHGQVIAYVRECNLKGFSPTIREIVANTDLRSTSAVQYVVDFLCEKNIMEREPMKARSIRIKEQE